MLFVLCCVHVAMFVCVWHVGVIGCDMRARCCHVRYDCVYGCHGCSALCPFVLYVCCCCSRVCLVVSMCVLVVLSVCYVFPVDYVLWYVSCMCLPFVVMCCARCDLCRLLLLVCCLCMLSFVLIGVLFAACVLSVCSCYNVMRCCPLRLLLPDCCDWCDRCVFVVLLLFVLPCLIMYLRVLCVIGVCLLLLCWC